MENEKEKRDKEFQRQTEEETERQRQKAEQMAIEAAKPKEPEYEEVTVYYFTSNTEKVPVECEADGEIQPCGVYYKFCKNETEYVCQTGLKAWHKTEKRLVKDEE